MVKIPHRLYLTEDEMPKQWYNMRADMKELPDPMINPATMKPAAEEDLYPVFCKKLAHQEMDNETRYVDIPDEILEMYKIYRPSPLIRAFNLEKALDTPAKIYYKFEGNNTSGSHKQFRYCAGLLRKRSGPERPHDGNRGRPVGNGACRSVLIFWTPAHGVHG